MRVSQINFNLGRNHIFSVLHGIPIEWVESSFSFTAQNRKKLDQNGYVIYKIKPAFESTLTFGVFSESHPLYNLSLLVHNLWALEDKRRDTINLLCQTLKYYI